MAQIAPVIELRGIKRTAWASEETHCYQATLYVDGEKWGTVSNQGHIVARGLVFACNVP